ncbi:MAG TPA: hypothetical protein DCP75_14100, partial [Haliea salexigens]|nr:hypothetical protein [Haliea salexigens]
MRRSCRPKSDAGSKSSSTKWTTKAPSAAPRRTPRKSTARSTSTALPISSPATSWKPKLPPPTITTSGPASTAVNLLLFRPHECSPEGQLRVTGRRAQHLRQVLQAKPGDELQVGQIDGLIGTAKLAAIDAHSATLQVQLHHAAPTKLPVTLLVA